jgi:hypothetical protein
MAGHGTRGGSEPIVYIDHSDIRKDSIDELRAGVQRLVDFIDAREPQLITYGFYIDEDAARMTVVAVHPDSASLERHMEIGSEEFRKLAHLLTLTKIECYGRPSGRALEQLRHKAATLGDGGVVSSVSGVAAPTRRGVQETGPDPDSSPRGGGGVRRCSRWLGLRRPLQGRFSASSAL